MSISFDRITTGTDHFVSVTLNITFVGLLIAATGGFASGFASLVALLVNIQFLDQVKINSTSQLISGIIKFLQKLLKCFNGTIISPFSVVSIPSNLPVILVL